MKPDVSTLPADHAAALIDVLSDEFRAHVYITITEKPGATIAELAGRIAKPKRRVRHQVERLLESGLVVVDPDAPRQHAREQRYRAIALAKVVGELDQRFSEDQRRKVAESMARVIVGDIGRAARERTLGAHVGHAVIRIPGEVDERGWQELARIMVQTMEEIEGVMFDSAARLEAGGGAGVEVVSLLLLFEGAAWDAVGVDRRGPRSSPWLRTEGKGDRNPDGGDPSGELSQPDVASLSAELRAAVIEALRDPVRAQIFITIFERPGATISQIASRTGEPSHRVRRHLTRLLDAGIVVVDEESSRRNARERHYRTLVPPVILDEKDEAWTADQRRRMAYSITQTIVRDIGRAVRERTFGTRVGHAEVRIPGQVDERGWDLLGAILTRAMERAEAVLFESSERLRLEGRAGIEAIADLLLFQQPPWESELNRPGLRPSQWLSGERAKQDPEPRGPSAR